MAQALQREFSLHTPEFIALHDLGMSSLAAAAVQPGVGAAGARVQRLSVRRQGHGVALAVLQFVEVPLADNSLVRVYSTDINAEGTARAQIARALLALQPPGCADGGRAPAARHGGPARAAA